MSDPHGEIHHMRITDSGQISVPAAVRRRWHTRTVRITDAGEHLLVEPEPANPFDDVRGRFAGLGVTVDELRSRVHTEEAHIEARRPRA